MRNRKQVSEVVKDSQHGKTTIRTKVCEKEFKELL